MFYVTLTFQIIKIWHTTVTESLNISFKFRKTQMLWTRNLQMILLLKVESLLSENTSL